MNKNKNIYIIGSSVGENSWGVSKPYLEFAARFGTPKVLMPSDVTPPADCDLVIMPGGADLTPSAYGELPGFMNSNPDQFKEHFYNNCLKNYVEKRIPLFGICLGAQMLCAYFGLKLKQNLIYHPHSGEDRGNRVHKMRVLSDKFISLDMLEKPAKGEFKGELCLSVNSMHHQGILIPKGMLDEAGQIAENYTGNIIPDGVYDPWSVEQLIESGYHKTLPIAFVQYHPEEIFDTYSARMMNYLLTKKEAPVSVA